MAVHRLVNAPVGGGGGELQYNNDTGARCSFYGLKSGFSMC